MAKVHNSKPLANMSEDSRCEGRLPTSTHVEKLRREMDSLKLEKTLVALQHIK